MANSLYFMFEDEVSLDLVREFFLSRKNYFQQEDIFVYENEDTEFAFTIEFYAKNADNEELPVVRGPHILMNINYLRSETYLEEVSIELEAFTANFDFIFYDEITGEITTFSLKRFKKNWKKANRSGLKGMLDEYGITAMQDELLRNAWTWNYHRRPNEQIHNNEYYFAKVMFECKQDSPSSVKTVCTWPDLIPIALPSFVDEVIIIRETHKKSSFLNSALGKQQIIETFGKRVNLDELRTTGAFVNASQNGINYLRLNDADCVLLQTLFQSTTKDFKTIASGIEAVSPERIIEMSISI